MQKDKPDNSAGKRIRRFSKSVAKRNQRRDEAQHLTLWPLLYTDIVVAMLLVVSLLFWFVDQPVVLARRSLDPDIVRFFVSITDIGKAEWILISTGLVCLLLVFVDWQGLQRRQQVWLSGILFDAWYMFVAVLGAGLITAVLKILVGRARPKFFDTLGAAHFEPLHFGYAFASFPSGHATTITALATVLALRFPKLVWLFAMLAITIASSRVVIGSHYPSDVVMGMTIGVLFPLVLARSFAMRKTGFRFVSSRTTDRPVPQRTIRRGARKMNIKSFIQLVKVMFG